MDKEFNFDLTEQTFGPFNINNEKYILVEADSETAAKYRNMAMAAARFSDGKVAGVTGLADVEPYLVSRCLFKVDAAGARHAVPLSTILKWPSRVTKPLYNKAQELSALKEEDKDDAKNSESGTEVGAK